MLNHFTFNGHSTGELGLLVSGINIYGSPSRVVEKVNIPYRSGDLLIDTGAYTNYMLTYTVDIMDNTKATAEAISKWLLGSKGYCELTDTYNPEIYRVASYYNQLDYTLSALYRYGKATITFDCKPQKYLTANQPVTLSPTTSEATSYSLSTPAMPLPITLEGNTTQKTMSGKNLLQITQASGTSAGVAYTMNSNGSVTISGTATATSLYRLGHFTLTSGVTYALSGNNSIVQMSLRDSTGGTVYSNNTATYTPSADVDAWYFYRVVNGQTVNATLFPQVEKGSTPTAYEPYCGGIPSPNPDYPQEIHSVSGDNEIRVVGKNLFNFNQWANDIGMMRGTKTVSSNSITLTATSNDCYTVYGYDSKLVPIVVQPNTTYTLTWKANNNNDGILYLFDGTDRNHALVNANNKTTKSVTFNTGSSTSIAYRFGVVYSGQSITYYDIQLEKGTATTFEAYKAQVYPINLPVQNLWDNSIQPTNLINSTYVNGVLTFNPLTSSINQFIVPYTLKTGETYSVSFDAYTNSGTSTIMFDGQPDSATSTGHFNDGSFTVNTTKARYKYESKIAPSGLNALRFYRTGTPSNSVYISNIQLEVGSKANSYTPYGVAPIELNALGTYKDYFHKTDGKWYLHKAFEKADLGSLTWARRTTNIFSSSLPTSANVSGDVGSFMSNYFIVEYAVGYAATNPNKVAMYKASSTTSTTTIYLNLSSVDTVADLTTWFSTNATELVYPLATPTETEITDATLISQLNALSKAKTYDGATNIVQDGNDAEFTFKLPVPAEISSEYFGEPIITVNEVGTIVWNDSLIKVNSAPVTINSQTLQCYYYSENKNNDVEINEFPKYEQGENYIGSTMALTVVPNYWKL